MTLSSYVRWARCGRQVVQVNASDSDQCDVDVVHVAAAKAALSALPDHDVVLRTAELERKTADADR